VAAWPDKDPERVHVSAAARRIASSGARAS